MTQFFRARCLGLMFASIVIPAGVLLASPVSTSNLFLAPSLVPADDYTAGPTFNTTVGRTFITGSDTLSLSFVPGSLLDLPAGSTITGVHILPALNPNPSMVQGEYSAADLAGINAGNSSTYFFRVPGTDASADYWADLEAGALVVNFNVTGQYFLNIDYLVGGVISSTALYHVQVHEFFARDGAPDTASVVRVIDGPTTDFNVVSKDDPDDKGHALETMATEASTRLGASRVARASTLQEACSQIKSASEKAGKKISVSLMGHGRPGSIKIGTERIRDFAGGTMTAAQFQACIDPYVSRIEFWSCETAQGDLGAKFLNDFAESLGPGSSFGWTEELTIGPTGWKIKADGIKVSESVPEPSSLLLVFVGLLVAARCSRARAT